MHNKNTFSLFRNTPPVNGVFPDDCPFETPNIIHLPMDIDCEFQQTEPSTLGDGVFKNITVSEQYKHIDDKEGWIYYNPDNDKKTIESDGSHLFRGLTYVNTLNKQRVTLEMTSTGKDVTNILNLHVYGFFLLAEILRVFKGSLREEIIDLMLSTKGDRIHQGKRLIADNTQGHYKNYIDFKRHHFTVNGIPYRFRLSLYDTCALQGSGSYKDLCLNTGVSVESKDIFTASEKARMMDMRNDRTDDFKNYALGDLGNYDCLKGHSENFLKVYKSLGVKDKFINPKLTIGATISHLLESCLQRETGIADINILHKLIADGTSQTFLNNPKDTSVFLGKVDGGRCRNNRPKDVSVTGAIADIDISGAYGNGLRNQDYPIGKPLVIEYPTKSAINAYMTLRQFLKKYRSELVPGLWFARVSSIHGELLKHKQDLFQSWEPPRDLDNLRVSQSVSQSDNWFTEDDPGLTKIFTNEIRMTVLTHDSLQWIENCCSKQQQKELFDNLIVKTALFYPASLECSSVENLLVMVGNHKGKNTTSYKDGTKKRNEQECHSWYRVSMKDLIVDVLLNERKKHPKNTPLNTLYKLCLNTVYGVMVSPHFKIGNVCVGNNVTARVRVFAWCMEKGFNGFQTITDGCAFELNRVTVPGVQSHTAESFVSMSAKGMNYRYAPLGNHPWEVSEITEDTDRVIYGQNVLDRSQTLLSVDKLAFKHLKDLFPGLDVLHRVTKDLHGVEQVGMFSLETKGVYCGISTHGTANYAFFNEKGESVKVKMRSYRKDNHVAWKAHGEFLTEHDDDYHPAKTFLENLYNTPSQLPRGKVFIHKSILKVSEWRKNYSETYQKARIFPGCTLAVARLIRECSLSIFTFQSLDQFLSWSQETDTLRRAYEQTYEYLFSVGVEGGVNYQAMINALEEAVRDGMMRYTNVKGGRGAKGILEGVVNHPEKESLHKAKCELREYQGLSNFVDRDPFGIHD